MLTVAYCFAVFVITMLNLLVLLHLKDHLKRKKCLTRKQEKLQKTSSVFVSGSFKQSACKVRHNALIQGGE